jgi:peptide chain release factor 1
VEARLRQALARAEEVARQLADPETARNPAKLKQLGREHAQLDAIRQAHQRLERLASELEQAREILADKDPELSQLARADVERIRPEIDRLDAELAELLTPSDPFDDRDAIVEIRAGTGGDEAALFAADLFRMYTRFSERRGWKVEILSTSEGTLGGLKEAVFAARGAKAYGTLRYESGVHRVQRVPVTEQQGAFIRRQPPSPCFPKPKRSTSRSKTRICASTCFAPAVPADRASTRPTARYA